MFDKVDFNEVNITFNSYDELSYKEYYGGMPKNRSYVRLFVNNKYATDALVYKDAEEDGREYVIINSTIEYLDTLKTLIDVSELRKYIFDMCEVTEEDFMSKKRDAPIVRARHMFMFIFNKVYDATLMECGRLTNRNHASVIHGCKAMQDLCDVNPEFKKALEFIINDICIKQN